MATTTSAERWDIWRERTGWQPTPKPGGEIGLRAWAGRKLAVPVGKAGGLKEAARLYFKRLPGTRDVPVARLKTIRAREGGIERAEKNMRASAEGKAERRAPIKVRKVGDQYEVVDGNSTVAIARRHGWRELPVTVVE